MMGGASPFAATPSNGKNEDAGSLELGFVYIQPACRCRVRSWTSSSPASGFILPSSFWGGRSKSDSQLSTQAQLYMEIMQGTWGEKKSLLHKQGPEFCLAVASASARRVVAQPAWFWSLRRQRQEILKTSCLERPCFNE